MNRLALKKNVKQLLKNYFSEPKIIFKCLVLSDQESETCSDSIYYIYDNTKQRILTFEKLHPVQIIYSSCLKNDWNDHSVQKSCSYFPVDWLDTRFSSSQQPFLQTHSGLWRCTYNTQKTSHRQKVHYIHLADAPIDGNPNHKEINNPLRVVFVTPAFDLVSEL